MKKTYEVACEKCNWVGNIRDLIKEEEIKIYERGKKKIKVIVEKCPECYCEDIVELDQSAGRRN